jgi:DNA replication and repair protein RecF
MAEKFERHCETIGELARVRLRYVSALANRDDLRAALADALEQKRALDVRRGLTHAGPHRDDLGIEIETSDGVARELRAFGSAGQQRTAAIALRLLEAETFRERRGRTPVLLLDDPFAELDARRAARIVALLEAEAAGEWGGQTILAVPRESDIPKGLEGLARHRIVGGALEAWNRSGRSP